MLNGISDLQTFSACGFDSEASWRTEAARAANHDKYDDHSLSMSLRSAFRVSKGSRSTSLALTATGEMF